MGNRTIHLRHILLMFLFAVFLLASISYILYAKNSPDIVFPDGRYHDFGTINEGELLNYEFIFRNNGNSNLIITDVKTGCGCTGAKISKELLPPGEEGKVLVSYRGRSTPKRESLPVWLISNDSRKPIVQLMLTGNIRRKVFWYPQSISFFADDEHKVRTQTVKFITDQTGKFELTKLRTSSKYIRTTCDANSSNFECKIDLIQGCPKGNSTEKIMCDISVGDEIVNIEIPVYLMLH